MFTFPYALLRSAQPWLWSVTSVTGVAQRRACSAAISRTGSRARAPAIDMRRCSPACSPGAGVLGIAGYWHEILIANSDPMVVAICLAAIDVHLSKRYRLTFALVLRVDGPARGVAISGVTRSGRGAASRRCGRWRRSGSSSIPLVWFGVSALTAKSWFHAGDLASEFGQRGQRDPRQQVHRGARSRARPVRAPDADRGGLAIVFAIVTREQAYGCGWPALHSRGSRSRSDWRCMAGRRPVAICSSPRRCSSCSPAPASAVSLALGSPTRQRFAGPRSPPSLPWSLR